MVHARKEIRRVLTDDGNLIDLRPIADRWPAEVFSSRSRQQVGRVTDLPEGLADDAAANEAMKAVEDSGLFVRQEESSFPFYYTWDSPREMQEYVEEEWADFIGMDAETWKQIRSAWAVADADARVAIRVKMLITRWHKTA
ncbi:MAG TPA: hypothetical protein VFH29_04275 [Anaerolineales bacterium]|nr:hypothetical protein [Anaerolineales bacterium]